MTNEACSNRAPEEDETRELFARFGRAYYFADVLHRGILHLCAFSRIADVGPTTRLRVEEHLRDASKLSLGIALTHVRSHFSVAVADQLDEAVERRNFLAHHFWYERAHLMPTTTGVEQMIAELDALADLFMNLDKEVVNVFEPLIARLGFTPTMMAACLDEVMRGEPMEPLPETRKPKKEEVLVGVYMISSLTNAGRCGLVFEADDGVIWQLCDAGLGWSPYKSVDPNWQPVSKLLHLLPARINPRPPISAPWTFDLVFGKAAVLKVRRDAQSGELLYTLKLTTQATR